MIYKNTMLPCYVVMIYKYYLESWIVCQTQNHLI